MSCANGERSTRLWLFSSCGEKIDTEEEVVGRENSRHLQVKEEESNLGRGMAGEKNSLSHISRRIVLYKTWCTGTIGRLFRLCHGPENIAA